MPIRDVDIALAKILQLEERVMPKDDMYTSLKRIADALERSNKLRVLELQFKSQREQNEHDDWLRQHGLGDLVEGRQ